MKIFFIILVLSFSSFSYGQKQQIALKAGVNFVNLNVEDLLMENFLSNKLSLVPELIFSSQGAK